MIALATCTPLPGGWEDEATLLDGLRRLDAPAEAVPWDEPEVDWERYERVIVRTTWNYTLHREAFLAWADEIGPRLRNAPELIRWNSDKRYVADLANAGIPVVDTRFVSAADPSPQLDGEVVVKPTISAGARDTGRFSAAEHAAARALIGRITAEGRTAMVQPYLAGVDAAGETAIVFLGGRESHVLRKRAVLRPDEEAPVREDDAIRAAEVMYRDDLVGPGEASGAERELAAAVVAELADRFGEPPLYARVDMLPGAEGEPVVLELEAVEPHLYLGTAPRATGRFADLIAAP